MYCNSKNQNGLSKMTTSHEKTKNQPTCHRKWAGVPRHIAESHRSNAMSKSCTVTEKIAWRYPNSINKGCSSQYIDQFHKS